MQMTGGVVFLTIFEGECIFIRMWNEISLTGLKNGRPEYQKFTGANVVTCLVIGSG